MRLIIAVSLFLSISTPCFAADPCASLLCLAGKAAGQSGGSSCSQPIADYFDIRAYGKHHVFLPWKTYDWRAAFLNSCPGNENAKASVASSFGSVFGR